MNTHIRSRTHIYSIIFYRYNDVELMSHIKVKNTFKKYVSFVLSHHSTTDLIASVFNMYLFLVAFCNFYFSHRDVSGVKRISCLWS